MMGMSSRFQPAPMFHNPTHNALTRTHSNEAEVFGQLAVLLAALLDALGSTSERVVLQVCNAAMAFIRSTKVPQPLDGSHAFELQRMGAQSKSPPPPIPLPQQALSVLGSIAGHPLHFRSVLVSLLDRWVRAACA